VVVAALGHRGWGIGLGVFGFLVLLFFRDPARRSSAPADVLLAPADGKVLSVDLVEDPEVGQGKRRRVVTFLSVFDVHVQRSPTAGEVVSSHARRGQKLAAYRPEAGERNEQHLTVVRRADGTAVGVRQIAGLVARRVVGYLHEGNRVERGQLLGVIKFGSRVDLIVPENCEILVRPGDRVRNGETPMARLPGAPQPGAPQPGAPEPGARSPVGRAQ
jgi:phosphatidylserine decarboxylase